MAAKLKRVILKISGEVLGENGKLFCHENFEKTAKILAAIQKTGVELAVVIGGGNVWRGRRGAATKMGVVAADQMGMLATLQNCLYMRDTLDHMGCDAVVMSLVDIPRFAESYNTVAADRHLKEGKIVFLACGLGNPCFSTDSAVVVRAIELNCDAILMAKAIDGVYTADPHMDPSAVLLPDISYEECARRDLRVVDPAAFVLLRDNAFPMVRIFALDPQENVLKVLDGDKMGTVLHP